MRRARVTLAAMAVGGILTAGLATPAHATPLRAESAPAAGTVQFTDASFTSAVLNSSKPVLVNFCAAWSSPCRALDPDLERVAAERNGRVVVGTLDIDENPVTPPRYRIRTIPSLLLFKNGSVVATRIGPVTKDDILRLIDPYL
ncbi:thioredoxin domain-containing protein [Streptosporangium sp. NPDC000239]|uniref:thioredoxin family protein n=1 Tax=Streptosporangium sp. NPDC000239 TaxID=3154248 RepID=UPI00331FCF87